MPIINPRCTGVKFIIEIGSGIAPEAIVETLLDERGVDYMIGDKFCVSINLVKPKKKKKKYALSKPRVAQKL